MRSLPPVPAPAASAQVEDETADEDYDEYPQRVSYESDTDFSTELPSTTPHADIASAFSSIGASASLWECMLNEWLARLYQADDTLQFEARIAQRQSLVKQLHERQLDLLITTETPKMDEFSSQLLGHFPLELYCAIPMAVKSELNYLRLEWGADFQQHEAGLIAPDDVPQLTTSSAEIACQQLPLLKGCTWLPARWADTKAGLHTVIDSTTISRPLYAIWLQNSDKQSQIKDLLKINIME